MKKKEIIGAILVAAIFVGGAVGYKLITEKNESKAAVEEKKSNSAVKDMTGDKTKTSVNKIDYKNLYTVANKEGNTASNRANAGYMAQQEKWVFFNDNGLCMALTDLKTGWKKINNDKPFGIEVIGDWVYYSNTLGQLVKVKVDGSDKKVIIDGKAGVFTIKDNWIYFVQGEQLCKMKTDGTERTLIMENGCLGFTLNDNFIYYGKSNDKGLWRICNDGSDDKKLLDNCSMFIIKGEWIYYKDFNGGLNKAKLDGSLQTKAVQEQVGAFGIDGDYLYYTANDIVNSTKELCKAKLDGSEKIKLYDLKKINSNSVLPTISITSENVCLISIDGKNIYKFKK